MLQNIEKYVTGKTQWIRLFDVIILGPAMMYAGAKDKKLKKITRALIFISGLGTVLYNGFNFYKQSAINKKYGLGPLESLTEINAAERLEGGPRP